jgi:hypothetical protein
MKLTVKLVFFLRPNFFVLTLGLLAICAEVFVLIAELAAECTAHTNSKTKLNFNIYFIYLSSARNTISKTFFLS